MTTRPANPPVTPAPRYTREEQDRIFDYFGELKSDYIRSFLAGRNLHRSGPKTQLLVNVREGIETGGLEYADLVNLLDTVIPWGAQHVFLYDGPEDEVVNWRRADYCHQQLQQNNVISLLREKLPLILPRSLSVSSIQYTPSAELKILAVQRREYRERCPEHDDHLTVDGSQIERHAYRHEVLRGIIIFTWNLVSNQARLQISQLPSKGGYETAEENFKVLTQPWLPFNLFRKVDLRRSITRLNELESAGSPEARSHGLSYRTLGGRAITAKSPTSHDSVLGETAVDAFVSQVRQNGVGHLGNFYWLPNHETPFEKEIHTIIVGSKKRINFTTPNQREDFEYVLSRVRNLCN
jgi:hypothetical protein